jgi:cytochrome P450
MIRNIVLSTSQTSSHRLQKSFFRRLSLFNTGRLVFAVHDYKGVTLKSDEVVIVPIAFLSIDGRLNENPMEIDFDRDVGQHGHNTFGNGPHKCVGSPLARAELYVFLEEWLKHIPDFRLDPDHSPVTHSGSVNGMNSLYLRWD